MMVTLFGGLLIGVSLGLLGSGGSILTVPVLTYGLGHIERVAIAESLLIVGAIALLGSASYVRARQVCWKTVLLFGIPGMAGAYAGAAVARYVSGTVQLLVFGVVMIAAAGFMFRSRRNPAESTQTNHSMLLVLAQGLAVGAMTGFVGVGGGFLIVPALIFLRRLPIHYAVGTSLLIIAFNSSAGFLKYADTLRIEKLSVDWITIGMFILLGTVGAQLGSRINSHLDPASLKRIFAIFLVAMSLFIMFRQGKALLATNAGENSAQTTVETS
jgi:uncharacterized membrane protein YfcA